MDQASGAEVFVHIRVVLGMVVSLSIARLLTGIAGFIQHPGRQKVYPLHLGWVASIFLLIIHAWWWEHRLLQADGIGFGEYLFLIAFCSLFYLLCTLLFPSSMEDYAGFEDYFFSRRKWFFGILALVYAADFVDTALKGEAYMAALGWEYPIRNLAYIGLSLAAIFTTSRRFHIAFLGIGLTYQLAFIFRFYDRMS